MIETIKLGQNFAATYNELGQLHSENDEPAYHYFGFVKEYRKNGKLHRIGKPAWFNFKSNQYYYFIEGIKYEQEVTKRLFFRKKVIDVPYFFERMKC